MTRTLAIFLLGFALAFAVGAQEDAVVQVLEEPDPVAFTDEEVSDFSAASLGIEAEDYIGRLVSEIYFELPSTMIERKIRRRIKLVEGRSFTRRRCRRTIHTLYLRGDVNNVVIKASLKEDGTVFVKIRVEPLISYRDFFLTGHRTFNEDEIRRILRFERGNEYRPEDKERLRKRLLNAYDDIGYLAAEAKFKVKVDEKENKADLFVSVSEGKPFRMRDRVIEGQPVFHEKTILRKLKWNKWWFRNRIVKRTLVKDGVDNLKRFYRRRHYYEVDVEGPVIVYDHDERKADLYIQIDAGKEIDIQYDKKELSHWDRTFRLNKVLEVSKQRIFNRWVIRELERKLKAFLQQKGYYDVEILSEYEETDTKKILRFFPIKEGKWKIGKIVFENTNAFNQKKLRRILENPKYYEKGQFEKALTHVIQHYNKNGFLQTEIAAVDVRRQTENPRLDIRIIVNEGPQIICEKIRFDGNENYKEEVLAKYVDLEEGGPLNPFLIKSAQIGIVEEYSRNGYINVRVDYEIVLDEKAKKAELVFHISEGSQHYFGDVYLKGNRLTKNHVIQRELFIEEGEPYNYEDVFRSEQALNRLGFFKSVKIEPVISGLTEDRIDLIVRVQERNSGYGSMGLGYNTVDGFQGTVEIGHRNLAGHGRKISIFADGFIDNPAFRIDKHKVAVTFFWPWVGRVPFDGTFTVSDQLREEELFDSGEFRIAVGVGSYFDRLLSFMRATQRYKKLIRATTFFRGDLEYAIEQTFIFDVDEEAREEEGIEEGQLFITTLTPQLIRNSRNDAFNPSAGSVNRIATEWATPYLGSEVNYLKVFGDSSWYFSLNPLMRFYHLKKIIAPIAGSVYAFNVSSGWATPLGRTDEVPVNKRYFLGGVTNLRGYNPAQVGPLGGGSDSAIGGNFMFYINQDFRIRLPKNFGLLFFFDMGNVYEDYTDFTWGDIRYAAGLGLRYITPVGPISADYGFALTRWGETDFGQFYISIGNAF